MNHSSPKQRSKMVLTSVIMLYAAPVCTQLSLSERHPPPCSPSHLQRVQNGIRLGSTSRTVSVGQRYYWHGLYLWRRPDKFIFVSSAEWSRLLPWLPAQVRPRSKRSMTAERLIFRCGKFAVERHVREDELNTAALVMARLRFDKQ